MSIEKQTYLQDIESLNPVLSGNEEHLVTDAKDFDDIYDPEKYGVTKRGLTNRHVSLMIIGQSIGTGIFVGLSSPLITSGSMSLFLGFVLYAFGVIYPLMQCVAEMCSWLPIKGSMFHFAARWIDPAFGFASALSYIFAAYMFVCVELTAMAGVISFWSDLNPGIWIALGLVLMFFFNIFGVKWYGEIEFVSSILKAVLIVGLMLFSLISMCGGNPKHETYGLTEWHKGGFFKEYLVTGNTGRFLGFWNVMIYAAFACGGPDLLMLISGEIVSPIRQNIALAGRRSYIRLYLFYLGGIFFMNTLCASNNPQLLAAKAQAASGAGASPWVIGIKNVGVHGLDSLINVIIMSSAWSCGNGFIYSGTRALYASALAGYAPRIFARCLKNGAPIYCVISAIAVCCLSFLSISNSTSTVFNWFVNLSTTAILCTYSMIFICYFRFRSAFKAQGYSNKDLYYTAPFNMQPYISYFGFGLCITVLFFNGFSVFFPGQFTVAGLFTSYFAPILFLILYLFWKFFKKTKMRSLQEADLITGKSAIDEEDIEGIELLKQAPRKTGKWYTVYYGLYDFLFT